MNYELSKYIFEFDVHSTLLTLKSLLSLVVLMFYTSANAQSSNKVDKPIQTVEKVFKDYIKYSESTDSEVDKDAIKSALLTLQKKSEKSDLPILINVWMYYDPTDFSVRELIEPIFYKNKSATLSAINKRLKNKKKWEEKQTAPYSELIELKNNFLN